MNFGGKNVKDKKWVLSMEETRLVNSWDLEGVKKYVN